MPEVDFIKEVPESVFADSTRRQRRTLLGVSTLIAVINLGQVKLTKFTILGTQIEVGKEAVLFVALFVVLLYFLLTFLIKSIPEYIKWKLTLKMDMDHKLSPSAANIMYSDNPKSAELRSAQSSQDRYYSWLSNEVVFNEVYKWKVYFNLWFPLLFAVFALTTFLL